MPATSCSALTPSPRADADDRAEARVADRPLETRDLRRVESRLGGELLLGQLGRPAVSSGGSRRVAPPGSRRPSSGRWANEYRANNSSAPARRAGRRVPPRGPRAPARRAPDRDHGARAPGRPSAPHAGRARAPPGAHLGRRHRPHRPDDRRGLRHARAPSRRRPDAHADVSRPRAPSACASTSSRSETPSRARSPGCGATRRSWWRACWTRSPSGARPPRRRRPGRSGCTLPTGTRARS